MKLGMAVVLLLCAGAIPARAQQVADSTFDTRVAHPAYVESHPRVLLDEAHHNFHTSSGRYRPFARLLESDGCRIEPGREPFSAASLQGADVLVIANAMGGDDMEGPAAERPAFSDRECDAVRAWVERGGALLLIADHAPFGAAAQCLARRFGVEMSQGYTIDPAHADPVIRNPSCILYTRENGLLAEHPITAGRDSTERVRRVLTFTGQSLRGPQGSAAFLVLGKEARDLQANTADARRGGRRSAQGTSAAGRAQALALRAGKGRVVVLGEAAMMSAQIATRPDGTFKMGMNREAIDNKQLALNILHWLTGLLD